MGFSPGGQGKPSYTEANLLSAVAKGPKRLLLDMSAPGCFFLENAEVFKYYFKSLQLTKFASI